MPLTSIIIPHYNRADLLVQAVASVKAQTSGDWEIIIVDDQSTPEVYEKIKLLAEDKIKIYQRSGDRPKGPSACRNIGVAKSVGEYLIFLDSDDLLDKNCVRQRVKVMEQNTHVKMGVFLMQEFKNEIKESEKIFNTDVPHAELSKAFIRNENPWSVTCPIWRKNFFVSLGGFDEDLFFMEDPDLHLRALLACKGQIQTFYNLPPDCYYRVNHFDETKQNFWYNSIFYQIRFFKKMTSAVYPASFAIRYKKDIKIGVYRLIRNFLYARKNEFPDLYFELIDWMKFNKIFTRYELLIVQCLFHLGHSTNFLPRWLKLKGVGFKLLPKK